MPLNFHQNCLKIAFDSQINTLRNWTDSSQARRFLVGLVKLVALMKIFSVFGANEVGALAKVFLI